VVGDGYAMGVTTQIAEYMLRPSERWFRVDHPVFSEQWSQPGSKGFRLREELQVSMKVEPAVLKRALECRDELAAKDATEHFDRKKERVAWLDPTRAIGRESTGWHHAIHMRVKSDLLVPGSKITAFVLGWVEDLRVQLDSRGFGVGGSSWQCGVAWIVW
jgi:hypothetical protein